MSFPTPPGYPTPPPGYPTPYPPVLPGTPGTVTTARVLGWIQGGLTIVLGVIMLIAAAAVSSASDRTSDDFAGLGDLATGALVIVAIVIFLLSTTVIIPVVLLKPGRTAPPIVLMVFQGLYILADVIFTIDAAANNGNPILFVFMAASSIAIIIVLLRPSARSWSAGTYAGAYAGAMTYPGYLQYPAGPAGGYPQQVLPPAQPVLPPPAGQYQQNYQAPGYGTNPYEQQPYQEQPYTDQPYTDQPYTEPPGQSPYGQSGPYQPPS